jgi:hypothetical protein
MIKRPRSVQAVGVGSDEGREKHPLVSREKHPLLKLGQWINVVGVGAGAGVGVGVGREKHPVSHQTEMVPPPVDPQLRQQWKGLGSHQTEVSLEVNVGKVHKLIRKRVKLHHQRGKIVRPVGFKMRSKVRRTTRRKKCLLVYTLWTMPRQNLLCTLWPDSSTNM